MKIHIEIISREMVSPSSPTPVHLNKYNLSFLDQIMPSFSTPSYFFFPASDDGNLIIINSERSNRLKRSLSQALSVFYPLAGRLVDNNYVNCNDEGVIYVEAQADCLLSDVINNPNPEELSKFLPWGPVDAGNLCLVVQATFFSCGGLLLGLGIAHKIVDGLSYFMFILRWASFSRGDDDLPIQSPKFESAILFPPKDFVREVLVLDKKENIVTERFVFSSTKIAELRDKYTKKAGIRPTRIEALSAFIGTRFRVATRPKVYALQIFAQIRERVVPPLSEYHFGNIVIPAIITMSENDDDGKVVNDLRDALRNVDGDSVDELQRRQQNESLFAVKDRVMLSFTNFCNFPIHKVDFGWGIPMVIGGPNIPINNLVCFSNSLSGGGGGGGIDAWVNLNEEDMTKFKADKELRHYVSNTKFMSRI